MRSRLLASVFLMVLPVLSAGPSELAHEEPKTRIQQLDKERFRIGKVEFDKGKRKIRFPAEVNIKTRQIIEAVIVHEKGRRHESLLVTKVSPFNLNIAFKLLSVTASDELFQILDANNRPTGTFPVVAEETKRQARMQISVEWEHEGQTKRVPINEWIAYRDQKTILKENIWLYTGSYVKNGVFGAEVTGDIVSIFAVRPSMINYPGKDHSSDEVWYMHRKNMPKSRTPVTVVISLPKV